MFHPTIQAQMLRQIRLLLASNAANVVSATLHWREVLNRPQSYDRNDESTAIGTSVENRSKIFRTFFHQIDHNLSGFQRFMEIRTGDVILDYLEDLDLDEKQDLRVEVGGSYYIQKSVGTALKEAWDVRLGFAGTLRTLLLSPAS